MDLPPIFMPAGAEAYEFGPSHPLRPERLRRTRALLSALAPDAAPQEPRPVGPEALYSVHSPAYVEAVAGASAGRGDPAMLAEFGFASGDNPAFPGMYEAALAYFGGSVQAAEAAAAGRPLAFNWAGGLHHAMRDRASGFCVFNDAAAACALLRAALGRVAYIDIDLHHGDGVHEIFASDPDVLTYSIHESGATLFPGTGFPWETGPAGASVNVPLAAGTSGDVWLEAFLATAGPALDRFRPEAVVLQAGCDAHRDDPLGHLECSVQDWLAAVRWVGGLGLPTVVLGGGGYNLQNVPRMWTAATLELLGREPFPPVPEAVPPGWGIARMDDDLAGWPRGQGREEAVQAVEAVLRLAVAGLPSSG